VALNVSQLDGRQGFRLNGIDANDESDRSVAGAGDINGDGIHDLIVVGFLVPIRMATATPARVTLSFGSHVHFSVVGEVSSLVESHWF
jgi:hypothetical protein